MYVVRTKRHHLPVARYYIVEEALARVGDNKNLEVFNEDTESVEDFETGHNSGGVSTSVESVSETAGGELSSSATDNTESTTGSTT